MTIESMIADQKAAKTYLKESLGKIAQKSQACAKTPGAAARANKRRKLRETAAIVIADAIERIREAAKQKPADWQRGYNSAITQLEMMREEIAQKQYRKID